MSRAGLALLLVGCVRGGAAFSGVGQSPRTFGYDIDARFTDPEVREIRDAMRAWEEACAGQLVLVETVPRSADIHVRRAELYELGSVPGLGPTAGTWHAPANIVNAVPTARLRAIVIHELGHAWGLTHSDAGATFMREEIGQVAAPDGAIPLEDAARACP